MARYVEITSDYFAHGRPIPSTLIWQMSENMTWCREQVDARAGKRWQSRIVGNLLCDSVPLDVDDDGLIDHWMKSGVKLQKDSERGHEFSGAEGNYTWLPIVARKWSEGVDKGEYPFPMYGGGGDLVLSCYMKSHKAVSQGTISFGVSGGPDNFLPGCAASLLAEVDLSTSWRRYWMTCSTLGQSFRGGLGMEVRVTSNVDTAFNVSGYQMWFGTENVPFYVSGVDYRNHACYQLYAGETPIFDRVISMDNALQAFPDPTE